MQQRPLGRTGLSIAPLVFGGNVFGWTADQKTSFDLLDRFAAQDATVVDLTAATSTAPLQARREQVVWNLRLVDSRHRDE